MGFKSLRRSIYHSPLSDCRRHHCLLTAFLLLCRDMALESFQVFLCQFMRVDTEYGISFLMCLRHTTCSVKTFLLCIVFDKRVKVASPISLQLTLHASCSLHTPGCSENCIISGFHIKTSLLLCYYSSLWKPPAGLSTLITFQIIFNELPRSASSANCTSHSQLLEF